MKTSKFSDSQTMAILKQGESGVPVATLCREHGISSATYYKWRTKFGGMDASLIGRLKELERENARLKRMSQTRCWTQTSSRRPWQKSGSAICPQTDGAKRSGDTSNQRQAKLPNLQRQPDLLPLRGKEQRREQSCRRQLDRAVAVPAHMRLWAHNPASEERPRQALESQAGVPRLL